MSEPLTDAQRVLSRARSLMANKGYGWSKAIAIAADTLKKTEPDESSRVSPPPRQR